MTETESNGRVSTRIQANVFDTPTENKNKSSAAVKLEPTSKKTVPETTARWWHSQFNLMLCVFALLAVAALILIQLSPTPVVSDNTALSSPFSSGSPASAIQSEQQSNSSWSDSQKAQARTDSQDILAKLIDRKKSLEQKGVSEWAQAQFQQALALAKEGDDFYKQQDYSNAINRYQSALDNMTALEISIPDTVAKQIADGLAAINQGKSALAIELFQKAVLLDPSNQGVISGLVRAKNLDQVLVLIEQARQDELVFEQKHQHDDLSTAQKTYQQAVDLDPQLQVAIEGLNRMKAADLEQRFKAHMSDGFKALFSGRNASAKKAFSKALSIQPNDATAASAYKQSLASDKTSSLNGLLKNAVAFERREDWQNALTNYQVILQRDSNQVSAKLGEIRSRVRSQLDEDIHQVLSDPLLLSNAAHKQYAEKTLSDAKAIKKKGVKLSEKIAKLELLLTQSDASIKVQFLSDAFTKVSLLKVGSSKISLGQFTNKNLILKPGRYVLTGIRIGYRDVRVEIELRSPSNRSSNKHIQTFTVRCEQEISAGRPATPILSTSMTSIPA